MLLVRPVAHNADFRISIITNHLAKIVCHLMIFQRIPTLQCISHLLTARIHFFGYLVIQNLHHGVGSSKTWNRIHVQLISTRRFSYKNNFSGKDNYSDLIFFRAMERTWPSPRGHRRAHELKGVPRFCFLPDPSSLDPFHRHRAPAQGRLLWFQSSPVISSHGGFSRVGM